MHRILSEAVPNIMTLPVPFRLSGTDNHVAAAVEDICERLHREPTPQTPTSTNATVRRGTSPTLPPHAHASLSAPATVLYSPRSRGPLMVLTVVILTLWLSDPDPDHTPQVRFKESGQRVLAAFVFTRKLLRSHAVARVLRRTRSSACRRNSG
jgi:hypothetical protein